MCENKKCASYDEAKRKTEEEAIAKKSVCPPTFDEYLEANKLNERFDVKLKPLTTEEESLSKKLKAIWNIENGIKPLTSIEETLTARKVKEAREKFEETIRESFGKNSAGAKPFINFPPLPTTPGEDFEKITSSICKVLTEKNKRYGNSALNPINVFNGKSKVGARADDKISRIQNNPVLIKNDVADLIGYLVLMCKENNWFDFSELID